MPQELPEGIGSKAPVLSVFILVACTSGGYAQRRVCDGRWRSSRRAGRRRAAQTGLLRREAGSNTPRSALSPRGHQLQPACTGRSRPNSPFSRQEAALPEHFIPEETTTTVDAKAGRSNISMACGSSASDWVRRRDVMAEDPGQPKCPCGRQELQDQGRELPRRDKPPRSLVHRIIIISGGARRSQPERVDLRHPCCSWRLFGAQHGVLRAVLQRWLEKQVWSVRREAGQVTAN